MTYYKVKPEYDQRIHPKIGIYVADELFTPSEVKNLNLDIRYLSEVHTSKHKTFFSFGARFEVGQD